MTGWDPTQAAVLAVDDEAANILLLERVLAGAGYRDVESTTDSTRVTELLAARRRDILLLDLLMPPPDGFALLEQIRGSETDDDRLPVLVLTADASTAAKHRALGLGASDFVTKPIDVTEVLLRVRNLLETRGLHRRLQEDKRTLEDRVRERTSELELAQLETVERLALAAEYRDDATGDHIHRVGETVERIALRLGFPPDEAELVGLAAGLHDVGKIGVPDAILLKPGPLSPMEFEIVKRHTEIGARILSASRSTLLRRAEVVASSHHERWDGTGYVGLAGAAIPIEGRITAVADAFDAMTHDRPYRAAMSIDQAIEQIVALRGRQFDAEVADAFIAIAAGLDRSEPRAGGTRPHRAIATRRSADPGSPGRPSPAGTTASADRA